MAKSGNPQGKKPIDLRSQGVAEAPGTEPVEPKPSFASEPYDPLRARETKRGQIAIWLVWALVGVIAVVVLTGVCTTLLCLKPDDQCTAKALDLTSLRVVVELVLTPLVGLVGAVTGFYFGEQSAAPRLPANENA